MNTVTLELDSELSGGHWVTIDGEHVYIKGDRIVAGPENLKGKTLGGAASEGKHVEAVHGAEKPAGASDDAYKAAADKMWEDFKTKPRELAPGYEYGKPAPVSEIAVGDKVELRDPTDRTSYGGLQGATITSVGPKNVKVEVPNPEWRVARGDPATTTHTVPKSHVQAVARGNVVHVVSHDSSDDSTGNYVLNLADATDSTPVPLGLEGFPATDSAGQTIHYRRMKIARVGKWTHRGTGQEFEITRDRADQWARNHVALSGAGVRPFIPGEHRDSFNAKDNHGYVVRVERDGDDVYAVTALHGDEALKLAAKNGRSIYVVNDAKDAKGNVYSGESLHHLALVPNPALPDLGDAVRIAASADRPAISVPVFTMAAATPTQKESEMNKELAQKFRKQLGVAADVADDKLADLAAEKALSLSADVATLTTERDTLKTDRDAKAQQVLALSASDKEPDALSLSLITRSFKTDRDRVVESGVVSEAGMKELDALLIPGGKPGKFALALSAGSPDPLYCRVCDILRRNPGVKVNNEIPRDVQARADAEDAIRLSLSGDNTDPKKIDRQAELLAEQLGRQKKTA